jgi:hypothetical protein
MRAGLFQVQGRSLSNMRAGVPRLRGKVQGNDEYDLMRRSSARREGTAGGLRREYGSHSLEVLLLDDKKLKESLFNAQKQIEQLNQMIRQMKGRPEFAADMTTMSRLQQLAQQANQEMENARNCSSLNMCAL